MILKKKPQIPGEDQGFQAAGGGGRGDCRSQPRQVPTGEVMKLTYVVWVKVLDLFRVWGGGDLLWAQVFDLLRAKVPSDFVAMLVL